MWATRRPIPFPFDRSATFLIFIIALAGQLARAQQPSALDRAIDSFASQIASAAGAPAAFTINFRNLSALSPAAAAACRRDLEAALEGHGLRIQSATPAGADIDLTLSENLVGVFWVADVRHSGAHQVLFMPFPPGTPGHGNADSISISLLKRDVFTQQDPILDFLTLPGGPDGPSQVVILEQHRVALHRQSGAAWGFVEAQPVPDSPVVRDLRGEIAPVSPSSTDSRLFVYRAGTACGLVVTPHLQLNCDGNQSPVWFLAFADGKYIGGFPVPERNFFSLQRAFTGEANNDSNGPYFSSAIASPGGKLTSVRVGLDGQARLFTGMQPPSATFSDWGSDVASISVSCSTDWHIVATGRGDWTAPDTLSVYRISDGEATLVGEPLRFSGPILTLWASADSQSVRVVSRDLDTGEYEASIVTASCSR